MFIIFGCVFEMPLITIILSKMGIINPQLLKHCLLYTSRCV